MDVCIIASIIQTSMSGVLSLLVDCDKHHHHHHHHHHRENVQICFLKFQLWTTTWIKLKFGTFPSVACLIYAMALQICAGRPRTNTRLESTLERAQCVPEWLFMSTVT